MTSEALTAALEKATDTRAVVVGRAVMAEGAGLIAQHLKARPIMIVADDNTWRSAGESLSDALRDAGAALADPLVLPATPLLKASYVNSQRIRAELSRGTPIALGSGTINDLVKVAAFEEGVEYACVGTAASMDGYTGAGAPMTDNGVKTTRNCKAPVVVVMDLDVVAAAPAHMTASGYGDLSAKIPGGADWILAHHTGVEPIDPAVWEMVQAGVRAALSRPSELAAGNPDAFAGLVEGLCLSGLAMQAFGGTRPASGAEHYFSHLWEIAGLGTHRNPPLSHGFKVAIGTLAMCAFHEALLRRGLHDVDVEAAGAKRRPWAEIEADIRAALVGPLADHAVRETRRKYVAGRALVARLTPLLERWSMISEQLRAQLVPSEELAGQLRLAGAPSTPEEIGLTRDDVRAMFPKAMYYRARYTALDVAWELGIFDELVEDVFASLWK